MTTYTYSLDHAIWTGEFGSRHEAIAAGVAHALGMSSPPETVYVGQKITPDDRAYGHGREIVQTMRRRVMEDNGDVADGFLRGLNEKQIGDLDNALEATIRQWMDGQNLRPSWTRIEAVSEHPVQSLVSSKR